MHQLDEMEARRGGGYETTARRRRGLPMSLRVFVLALATFATGTGTFIVAGLLGGVAEALSVSVGTAGHLVTVIAVAYAALSPILVAMTGRVARRRLLVAALILFAAANAGAAVAPRPSPYCWPPGSPQPSSRGSARP